jgi:hypothetical protein
MLRHCFIVDLPALVPTGCTSSSRLQSTPSNKYEHCMSVVGPEKSKDMLYRDELLIIQLRMTGSGFRFKLQNISQILCGSIGQRRRSVFKECSH